MPLPQPLKALVPFPVRRLGWLITRWPLRWPTQLKHYPAWLRSLREDYSIFENSVPWLTYDAIDWLNENLTSRMRLFEYGSGGSTLYFAKRVNEVISLEHDREWYNKVNAMLQDREVTNVELKYVPPDDSSDGSSELDYRSYVEAISRYEDESFDFILVDGRARSRALRKAFPKTKVGGHLMLDDSERDRYESAKQSIEDHATKTVFRGLQPGAVNIGETTLYRREE